jgi:hypothetical protein
MRWSAARCATAGLDHPGDRRQGGLAGIFTGRDAVCRAVAAAVTPSSTILADADRGPITLKPEETAIDALRLMWDGGFGTPLVTRGKILGVVSRGDFKGVEYNRHEDERDREHASHMELKCDSLGHGSTRSSAPSSTGTTKNPSLMDGPNPRTRSFVSQTLLPKDPRLYAPNFRST